MLESGQMYAESNRSITRPHVMDAACDEICPSSNRKPYIPLKVERIARTELEKRIRSVCGNFSVHGENVVLGSTQYQNFGRIQVARFGLTDLSISRTESAIKSDCGEHFFMLVQESGSAIIQHAGHEQTLSPGELILCDARLPSLFVYGSDFSVQSSIHLKFDLVSPRYLDSLSPGSRITSDNPIGLAIVNILKIMQLKGEKGGRAYVEPLLGLIGGALAELRNSKTPDKGVRKPVLQLAQELIATSYGDPDLRPARLAKIIGVSTRSLQRAFKPTGMSPGAAIAEMRLMAAHERLTLTNDPVLAVAYECGFNDLSNFYRRYKDRFGNSPGSTGGRGRTSSE